MFLNLPEKCFSKLPTTGETILIKRGEKGYYEQDQLKWRDPDELNDLWDITKGQSEAMSCGSMFGWDTPASNPANYDEEGKWIRVAK